MDTGWNTVSTETLELLRNNLIQGLKKVAAHIAAGTFEEIPPGKSSPPSQSGQLTLALLNEIEAELADRIAHVNTGDQVM
jgi:hypothetical protein